MLILLHFLGLIFVIVAPIFVYLKAKRNGHNAVRWTLLSLAAGIGIQWILPITIRIIGSFFDEEGKAPLGGFATILLLFCLFLSVAAVAWILRRVGQFGDNDLMSINQ